MAKDNELLTREKELAREYEKKMTAREQRIRKLVSDAAASPSSGDNTPRNIASLFESKFAQAFSPKEKRYEKPSAFFLAEMPWIFGPVVYDRWKDGFLHMVDRVTDYPYSVGWTRRSFRSERCLDYQGRICTILVRFSSVATLDADIRDLLSGNLPEDALCYIKHRNHPYTPYVPEMLAYALDQEDPALEKILEDIISGDNSFTRVTHSLIQAIVMSHNSRMHDLLCKLLLAARLQEGLRQAICENADYGTKEAFLAILSTIAEHDLIRFSSVKRAVGTWIGVISEETRDLDRVSGKSVELIQKCLTDESFRAEAIRSEDAMAIHIALWSDSYDSVQRGYEALDRIIDEGTDHQILTAGYFVANLESTILRHVAARSVLKAHRDRMDLLAVYLPSFLPDTNYLASALFRYKKLEYQEHYFESPEQAAEFCDWLMTLHGSMNKKELEFSPCIFPWYSASLRRSDLVEKAMVIASLLDDRQRKDRLCAFIPDCDTYGRSAYLRLLADGKKTPASRAMILSGIQDKSEATRLSAFEQAKGMGLTPEEYRRLEDMLRLRYDDLRRGVMELLMLQSDEALEATIRRLLSSSKSPVRTAGLDLVTQLHKSEDRMGLAQSCMDAVLAIAKPTTQEKILIDALKPAPKQAEPLFTEADRVLPAVEIGDYELECIRIFQEIYPHSSLLAQILAGKPVLHDDSSEKTSDCPGAARGRQLLQSLSDFVAAHERDTFTHNFGHETPLGAGINQFAIWLSGGGQSVPRMDLWQQWQRENAATESDLFAMMTLCAAQPGQYPYLIRCGAYVCDAFGPGFDSRGDYRFAGHIERITFELIKATVPEERRQQIALALGIWIARCLPEEMYLGVNGQSPKEPPKSPQGETILHYVGVNGQYYIGTSPSNYTKAGHFIMHPQFSGLIHHLDPRNTPGLRHRIPVILNIYQKTYASTRNYLESMGAPRKLQSTMLLNQIFCASYRLETHRKVEVSLYLYACHYGLISERSLFAYLMEPGNFKSALELITSVCAMEPKNGERISSRTHVTYRILRDYEQFVGKNTHPEEEQRQLAALCHRTAGKLLPVVLDTELNRGDTPTEYSPYISGIHALSGMETFVRILCALGRDSLDRSVYYYWSSGQTKRGNLSHLLARCAPGNGDDVQKLRRLLENTDITEKRLMEAALYSPSWIDLIGEYLNLPGFKSACYYFMAHMNEKFDDQRKAIIARYTPLTEDELNLGAFDVQWFHSAFAQLGERKFDLIYDAAKYISDGSKHTRARKYADAALGRLTVGQTEAEIRDKRNKDLLMAYAIIPLDGEQDLVRRYLYLQQFLKESRQFGSQRSASEKKAVETAMRNLATNAGFADPMRLTLRMETKLVEDNRELFEERPAGEWTLRLAVDEKGSAEILCWKDGKLLKSIPSKLKKDPYVLRLTELKKQLTEQYRRTRRMLEQAMEDGAVFTLEEMGKLCSNPVVAPIVSALIFKTADGLGLFRGQRITDLDGTVICDRPDAELVVAHPLHLYSNGRWAEFQKYLYDHRCVQPFRQVFRELYVKTWDELGCLTSLRYAGHQIQPQKAVACLKDRRWVADVEAGLQKIYYQDNIVATIYAMADWFTPADIEAPTLEHVAFYDRKTGEALRIDAIPDVIFSEVMRDVDLMVSVAHVGGVDPETSHSTVEMRAAILAFTLPLLRLNNVRVEGSHAFVDGKLARYSIHLGSGVVHQLGGAMLNVLPVHSQHRGRFFLPFMDDDPKTAEIISKVILFAEDHKLKDPTILDQITG